MDTRENKYSENRTMSRISRNEELYKEINDGELDNFSIKSNAEVIGSHSNDIDIEKIKKILDKRYNEAPKRRSINVPEETYESKMILDDTKEYDLSKVLEKAKDEKDESYDEVRAKRLKNTQFDILKDLNIEEKEGLEEKESSEDDLMDLINTITLNEAKQKEENDLFEDLKGSENTQVYESLETEVTKVTEIREKEPPKEEALKEKEPPTEGKIDNSFYTHNLFKKKDFEDENEFVEDEKLSVGVKILIVLVVVVFLVGLFLFLKSFLNF